MAGRYKDAKLYGCMMLNHLIASLGAGVEPWRLEEAKLVRILADQPGVSKAALRNEIRSNHAMTSKVLEALAGQNHVVVEQTREGYTIKITAVGLDYARRFNRFYLELYQGQINEHYRYRGAPAWVRLGR